MSAKYCSLRSLSAYHELRRKELQNKRHDNELENPSTNDAQNESQLTLLNANEAECASELQPRGDENLVIESQQTTTNPNEAPRKKKNRSPTKLAMVHARTLEERPSIILNSYGQPIGPTKKVAEYSHFLGTLARNPKFAPLNYCEWPSVPTHEKIWNYIQEKYRVASP